MIKKRKKHSVESMKELAKIKGISFQSTDYYGMSTLHLWKCAKGHLWEARPGNITYIPFGKCPKCSNKKKVSLVEINEQIIAKGGELLSQDIANVKSYIKIRCKHNHEWETQVNNLRAGKWCPICGGSHPLNIEILRKKAKERGGKLISEKYTNANSYYEWQCSEGHIWKAKYGNIHTGGWCKQCTSSLGERICRLFFQELFGVEFPSSFPKWLRINNKVKLELDGYNEGLKLAFEHQGEQHFNTKTQFIKSDEKLKQRQNYDLIKKELCQKNGIVLIEVPEINNKIKIADLKNFIKEQCIKNKITLPVNYDKIVVDHNQAYRTPEWRLKLTKLMQIAESKGGACLSDFYKSSNIKLTFRCKLLHEWTASPNKILMGRWCPQCAKETRAKKRRLTIEMMRLIASERSGSCLSDTYVNSQSRLKWRCAYGHEWLATPSSINSGAWCNICSNKGATLKKRSNRFSSLKALVTSKSGICISNEYLNYNVKLKFKCQYDHEFHETPSNIKKGKWCKICKMAKSKNKDILQL
jgi:hypothetical protein